MGHLALAMSRTWHLEGGKAMSRTWHLEGVKLMSLRCSHTSWIERSLSTCNPFFTFILPSVLIARYMTVSSAKSLSLDLTCSGRTLM